VFAVCLQFVFAVCVCSVFAVCLSLFAVCFQCVKAQCSVFAVCGVDMFLLVKRCAPALPSDCTKHLIVEECVLCAAVCVFGMCLEHMNE